MRATLAVLIGIVGGEIASGLLVYMLGAPAWIAFNLHPLALAVRLADPITLVSVAVIGGITWAVLPVRSKE